MSLQSQCLDNLGPGKERSLQDQENGTYRYEGYFYADAASPSLGLRRRYPLRLHPSTHPGLVILSDYYIDHICLVTYNE